MNTAESLSSILGWVEEVIFLVEVIAKPSMFKNRSVELGKGV